MSCAIVAKKMGIKVAHIEGGIRSFDHTMPEEINRLVTDSISDIFFTTSATANFNLIRSGFPEKAIHFVGNTMVDTLLTNKNRFEKPSIFDHYNLINKKYLILTLHRPANVDDKQNLHNLLSEIIKNSENIPIVFPVHPRTKEILDKLNLKSPFLIVVSPMSYLKFNFMVNNSLGVITDSGGITEETTMLDIPCMTLRDNTERPETCSIGTNILVGTNPKNIKIPLKNMINGNWKKGAIPELWDGQTGKRILERLSEILSK
jgi:UDP-N-acetylglucosamine 2-epimerase (non-hydrolysing)